MTVVLTAEEAAGYTFFPCVPQLVGMWAEAVRTESELTFQKAEKRDVVDD